MKKNKLIKKSVNIYSPYEPEDTNLKKHQHQPLLNLHRVSKQNEFEKAYNFEASTYGKTFKGLQWRQLI